DVENGVESLDSETDLNLSDVNQPEIPPAEPGWRRLMKTLLGGLGWAGKADFTERIRYLNQAIDAAPETSSNYVLPGEVYFEAGEYALAQADFQRAYDLAVGQFERSNWGLMAQAMRDRALAGLEKSEKKLKALNIRASTTIAGDQTNTDAF